MAHQAFGPTAALFLTICGASLHFAEEETVANGPKLQPGKAEAGIPPRIPCLQSLHPSSRMPAAASRIGVLGL